MTIDNEDFRACGWITTSREPPMFCPKGNKVFVKFGFDHQKIVVALIDIAH
jgi:hypothetical protein